MELSDQHLNVLGASLAKSGLFHNKSRFKKSKTNKGSCSGKSLVSWIIATVDSASSRTDGIMIGQDLLRAGVIESVEDKAFFLDDATSSYCLKRRPTRKPRSRRSFSGRSNTIQGKPKDFTWSRPRDQADLPALPDSISEIIAKAEKKRLNSSTSSVSSSSSKSTMSSHLIQTPTSLPLLKEATSRSAVRVIERLSSSETIFESLMPSSDHPAALSVANAPSPESSQIRAASSQFGPSADDMPSGQSLFVDAEAALNGYVCLPDIELMRNGSANSSSATEDGRERGYLFLVDIHRKEEQTALQTDPAAVAESAISEITSSLANSSLGSEGYKADDTLRNDPADQNSAAEVTDPLSSTGEIVRSPTVPATIQPRGKSVLEWDTIQVQEWLGTISLPRPAEIVKIFKENDVDGEFLLELDGETLKEMGIVSLGVRRKLSRAIATLEEAGSDGREVERSSDLSSFVLPSEASEVVLPEASIPPSTPLLSLNTQAEDAPKDGDRSAGMKMLSHNEPMTTLTPDDLVHLQAVYSLQATKQAYGISPSSLDETQGKSLPLASTSLSMMQKRKHSISLRAPRPVRVHVNKRSCVEDSGHPSPFAAMIRPAKCPQLRKLEQFKYTVSEFGIVKGDDTHVEFRNPLPKLKYLLPDVLSLLRVRQVLELWQATEKEAYELLIEDVPERCFNEDGFFVFKGRIVPLKKGDLQAVRKVSPHAPHSPPTQIWHHIDQIYPLRVVDSYPLIVSGEPSSGE